MSWTTIIDTIKQVTSDVTGIRKVLIRDEERPFHDAQMVFLDLDVAPIGEDVIGYCTREDGTVDQISVQQRRLGVLFSFESTQHRPELLGPVLASKFIAGIRGENAQEALRLSSIGMQDVQATAGANYSHDGRRVSVGQALAFFTVGLVEVLQTNVDYFDKVIFDGDLDGIVTVNPIGPVLVGPVSPCLATQSECVRSFLWTVPDPGALTTSGSRTWPVALPLAGMTDATYIVVPEQVLVDGALRADLSTKDQTTTGFTLVAVNGFLIVGTQIRFFIRDSDEP